MNDSRRVDLHVHTIFSDGDLTPETLVCQALDNDLAAVAVTDHDTVMGVGPVMEAARGTGLEIIAGVELSSSNGSNDIHVLGYLVDCTDDSFLRALALFQRKRSERAIEMVRLLHALGLRVRMDLVLEFAGDGSIGRPHVAQALLEQRLTSSFEEAFRKYIGYGGPAYVEKHRLEPSEAFALIRRAGGVAGVAHPGTLRQDSLLPGFVSDGMEAIEVWHPRHGDGQSEKYGNFAREHGLAMTGGSDSHGVRTGLQNFRPIPVTYEAVRALRRIADSRHHTAES
ncbi:MAG: PHP domain-containing protein [Candidatus Eisenbacteria sp.]|nr:PHP domain-containing protein [Candidatus Eisenbacteria bacterium]